MKNILGMTTALVLCAIPALAQDGTYDITLRFDPQTAATLTASSELVTVAGWYYGEPARADVPTDEMGLVYLGGEDITVHPQDQTITMGRSLATAPLGDVATPMINVNIFTARRSSEYNLIHCDFVDAPMAEVQAQNPVLNCTLLEN